MHSGVCQTIIIFVVEIMMTDSLKLINDCNTIAASQTEHKMTEKKRNGVVSIYVC